MYREFKNTAYIALGSNKGNSIQYLRDAIEKVECDLLTEIEKISPVFETLPFGNKSQANFLNTVIKIKTSYGMHDLFKLLKQIEKELGRTKSEKWGPRCY